MDQKSNFGPKTAAEPEDPHGCLVKAINEIHETWFNVGRGEDEDEVLNLLMYLPSGVCFMPFAPATWDFPLYLQPPPLAF